MEFTYEDVMFLIVSLELRKDDLKKEYSKFEEYVKKGISNIDLSHFTDDIDSCVHIGEKLLYYMNSLEK